MLWAFATGVTVSRLDVTLTSTLPLFAALARVVQGGLGKFNPQELANTSWAFAKADQLDALLFAMLAKAVEQLLGDFNAQDLANTA